MVGGIAPGAVQAAKECGAINVIPDIIKTF